MAITTADILEPSMSAPVWVTVVGLIAFTYLLSISLGEVIQQILGTRGRG